MSEEANDVVAEVSTEVEADANPQSTDAVETTEEKGWYEGVSETLRRDPSVAKFQNGTIDDVLQAHINQGKLLGVDKDNLLVKPSEGDLAGFRTAMHALGLPESIDDTGYQLAPTLGATGEPLGEDFGAKGPLAEVFRQSAFKHGVPPQALQPVFDDCNRYLAEQTATRAAEVDQKHATNLVSLDTEFGSARDVKVNAASFVAEEMGLTDVLNDAGLGTDPRVVGALAQIAPFFDEQSGGNMPAAAGGKLTPASAEAKALELQNEAFRLERNDPRRKTLNIEAQKFWQMAS
jgi:hypothetical protein